MHSEQDLLALAAQSGKNDLAFLIKAKEDAKRRMSENASPENVRAFNTAKDAVETEAAKLQPVAPGLTFRTQLGAVDRLTALGYKIGKSKFNDDFKTGKIARGPEGFEDWALREYAQRMQLPVLAKAEHSGQVNSTAREKDATARLKDIQAARQELKFQKEQGLFMLKSEHEAAVAARALFFKNEIESFIRLRAAAIVHLVGGREDAEPLLIEWLEEATADWMDSWSKDREFTVDDDPKGDETGEEIAEDMETEE